jgi:uncharacterized Zn-binding protein involved in type VI secretion
MGKPAARIGDMHICPMVTPGTPPVPHVGGPIIGPGIITVVVGGIPAAVVGDLCTCVGPPDAIVLGSIGVLIGNKPAARIGDQCAHGGAISTGLATVMIGDIAVGTLTPAQIRVILDVINSSNSVVNCGHIIDFVIAMLRGQGLGIAPAGGDGTFDQIGARHGTNIDFSSPTNFNAIFADLQARGPGSMTLVGIDYNNGSSHVVVAANVNGQTGIIEGQNWGPGQDRGLITDPAVANARYNSGGGSTIAANAVP